MAYFEKEELRQAKQMSAIEFLKRYRPEELVRCGTGEYELRSHDSFKISESTSLWHWKSRDIGGKARWTTLSVWRAFPLQTRCGICWSRMRPHTSRAGKSKNAGHLSFLRRRVKNTGWSCICKAVPDVIRHCISRGDLAQAAVSQLCVRRPRLNGVRAMPRCVRPETGRSVQGRTGGKRQTASLLHPAGGEKPACRSG